MSNLSAVELALHGAHQVVLLSLNGNVLRVGIFCSQSDFQSTFSVLKLTSLRVTTQRLESILNERTHMLHSYVYGVYTRTYDIVLSTSHHRWKQRTS